MSSSANLLDELKGRAALVTGSGSGIGQAVCVALARAGCHVMCSDIDLPTASATAAACRAAGVNAEPLSLDAGDQAAVHGAIDLAERWARGYGGISLFVANAGVLTIGGLDTDVATWERAIRVNTISSQISQTIRAAI